jgi:hypothetical protein
VSQPLGTCVPERPDPSRAIVPTAIRPDASTESTGGDATSGGDGQAEPPPVAPRTGPHQGWTRWTGLPRIETCQVVESVAVELYE